MVNPNDVPEITPPTVKVLAVTVTVRVAESVTAPVPISSGCVPVKVKLAFQLWGLLVVSVIAPAEVLSIVPPEIINVPVPIAEALLMFKVPALKFVPPE